MLNGSQANSPFTILVLLLPLTSSFFNSKPSKESLDRRLEKSVKFGENVFPMIRNKVKEPLTSH